MIKHVVMWNLKDEALGRSREENAKIIKTKLKNLENEIDELLSAEVGINIADDEQACDVVLLSKFDSLDNLKSYAGHKKHLEAAKFIGSVAADRKVVDYNSDR